MTSVAASSKMPRGINLIIDASARPKIRQSPVIFSLFFSGRGTRGRNGSVANNAEKFFPKLASGDSLNQTDENATHGAIADFCKSLRQCHALRRRNKLHEASRHLRPTADDRCSIEKERGCNLQSERDLL